MKTVWIDEAIPEPTPAQWQAIRRRVRELEDLDRSGRRRVRSRGFFPELGPRQQAQLERLLEDSMNKLKQDWRPEQIGRKPAPQGPTAEELRIAFRIFAVGAAIIAIAIAALYLHAAQGPKTKIPKAPRSTWQARR